MLHIERRAGQRGHMVPRLAKSPSPVATVISRHHVSWYSVFGYVTGQSKHPKSPFQLRA
jgi:hypothetical protein